MDVRDVAAAGPENESGLGGFETAETGGEGLVDSAGGSDAWLVALLIDHAERDMVGGAEEDEEEHGSAAAPLDLADEAAFPGLLLPDGASGAGATHAPRPPSKKNEQQPHHRAPVSTSTLGARLILQALHEAFPMSSSATIEACFVEAGGGLDRAASLVAARDGVPPQPGALRPRRIAAPANTSSSASPSQSPYSAASAPPRDREAEAFARVVAASVARVSTGDAVARVYEEARGEATALARARNAAFDRATRAYLAGTGAEAARFSRQGRDLDAKMRRAHAQAARAIFAARNDAAGGGGGGGVTVDGGPGFGRITVPVFDLHGLHPSEAADVAEEAVAVGGGGAGGGGWVALLAGARQHSKKLGKGGGSLTDAVRERLDGMGAEVYEGGAGGGGVLVVRTPRGRR
jgi:hypothetical protein